MTGANKPAQEIQVSISYDPFTVKFYKELESHLASLRNVLGSISKNTYSENAEKSVNSGFLGLSITNETKSRNEIAEREIQGTFVDFMRSFIDFLDSVIAASEIIKKPPKLTKQITNLKELEQYIDACIAEKTRAIAKDTSLTNPKKLDKIPKLSAEYDSAIRNYFVLRASIEHNKSLAKSNIKFSLQRQGLFTDKGTEIKSTPIILKEASTISLKVKWETKRIQKDEPVEISELDLEHLFMTFRTCIVPQIITKLIQPIN